MRSKSWDICIPTYFNIGAFFFWYKAGNHFSSPVPVIFLSFHHNTIWHSEIHYNLQVYNLYWKHLEKKVFFKYWKWKKKQFDEIFIIQFKITPSMNTISTFFFFIIPPHPLFFSVQGRKLNFKLFNHHLHLSSPMHIITIYVINHAFFFTIRLFKN
jgi:hypothetical protein